MQAERMLNREEAPIASGTYIRMFDSQIFRYEERGRFCYKKQIVSLLDISSFLA